MKQPAQKSPFSRLSLRTNLLLLLACLGVFLVADRAREIIDQRGHDVAHARTQLLALAKEGAQRQADLIAEAKAILRLATILPEREGTSLTACQVPFRQLVADRPWLITMAVLHPKGQPICSSADRVAEQNLSDRDYFKKTLATKDFVLSELIIHRLTQSPAVVAAMPRMAHGKVQAVIIASIDIGWLGKLAAETVRFAYADVILADANGTIFAAHTHAGDLVGTSIATRRELWTRLQSGAGVFESSDFDGEDRIIGYAKLPGTGAVLAVMRSRSDVLAEANRQAWHGFGKIAATGLLCLLVIWLGSQRMVLKPLRELTTGAARLGSGDLTARVKADRLSPELRVLADTFNAMAAQLEEHQKKLQKANMQLSELASTDGLTGLANRRRFDEQVETEWRRSLRSGTPISLAMLDVDNFKAFNDRYGHLAGDECLQRIAEVLRTSGRRPADLAVRTGGEEFAVLLPGADLEHATAIAEGIRAEVAALAIEHLGSAEGHVTVSIGVAATVPHAGRSTRMLLNAADAALYAAKRGGRNRVVVEPDAIALAS